MHIMIGHMLCDLIETGLISKNEYSDNWCRRFYWIKLYIQLVKKQEKVIALDKLTYAGNLDNFKNIEDSPFFCFLHGYWRS